MPGRGRSADPRAERVHTRLRDAAFALAGERRVEEISVADLVARAQVSRQVFYRHFRDRDDAVAAAFSHVFGRELAETRHDGDARDRILDLFGVAARHPDLCRNVANSTVHQHVLVTYRDVLSPPCRQIAEQGMAVLDTVSSVSTDAVTRFLVGGFVEVLRNWMDDPEPADLDARVRAALDTVDALLGHSTAQKGPDHG